MHTLQAYLLHLFEPEIPTKSPVALKMYDVFKTYIETIFRTKIRFFFYESCIKQGFMYLNKCKKVNTYILTIYLHTKLQNEKVSKNVPTNNLTQIIIK